jgi:hypothetical protein
MTYAEFHLAVRRILASTRFRTFVVNVEVVEHHVNRVAVEWRVWVPEPDSAQRTAHHVRRSDPARALEALAAAVRGEEEPAPPSLHDIGAPPEALGENA